MKRKCKVCGKIHQHCPFTDCFDGSKEELPDNLEEYYKNKFGGK